MNESPSWISKRHQFQLWLGGDGSSHSSAVLTSHAGWCSCLMISSHADITSHLCQQRGTCSGSDAIPDVFTGPLSLSGRHVSLKAVSQPPLSADRRTSPRRRWTRWTKVTWKHVVDYSIQNVQSGIYFPFYF